MLQMLVQNLQLLYHNRQQQVDMENYMNYMLLNPPRRINRRATRQPWQPCSGVFFAAFGVFCGGSTAPLTGPAYVLQRLQRFRAVSCERNTLLISYSVRLHLRLRVNGVCVCVCVCVCVIILLSRQEVASRWSRFFTSWL